MWHFIIMTIVQWRQLNEAKDHTLELYAFDVLCASVCVHLHTFANIDITFTNYNIYMKPCVRLMMKVLSNKLYLSLGILCVHVCFYAIDDYEHILLCALKWNGFHIIKCNHLPILNEMPKRQVSLSKFYGNKILFLL